MALLIHRKRRDVEGGGGWGRSKLNLPLHSGVKIHTYHHTSCIIIIITHIIMIITICIIIITMVIIVH